MADESEDSGKALAKNLAEMEDIWAGMVEAGRYEEAKKGLAETFEGLFKIAESFPEGQRERALKSLTQICAGMKSRLEERHAAQLDKDTALLKDQKKQSLVETIEGTMARLDEEVLAKLVEEGHYEVAENVLAETFEDLFKEVQPLPEEKKGQALFDLMTLQTKMKTRLSERQNAQLSKATASSRTKEKQPEERQEGKEHKPWWKKLLRAK